MMTVTQLTKNTRKFADRQDGILFHEECSRTWRDMGRRPYNCREFLKKVMQKMPINSVAVPEIELCVFSSKNTPILSGKADVLVIPPNGGEKCAVIDWKFGDPEKTEEIEYNTQLLCYSIAAMQCTGTSQCDTYIYFPKVYSTNGYDILQESLIQQKTWTWGMAWSCLRNLMDKPFWFPRRQYRKNTKIARDDEVIKLAILEHQCRSFRSIAVNLDYTEPPPGSTVVEVGINTLFERIGCKENPHRVRQIELSDVREYFDCGRPDWPAEIYCTTEDSSFACVFEGRFFTSSTCDYNIEDDCMRQFLGVCDPEEMERQDKLEAEKELQEWYQKYGKEN